MGEFGSGTTQPATQTQTSTTTPWATQQPFLEFGFNEAQRLYEGDTPNFFPGSTVVPFSGASQQALSGMEQRAAGGSPIANAGRDVYGQTLAGDFTNQGNPGFAAMVERIKNQVAPAVSSQFGRSGRQGSGGHEEAFTRAMADSVAPLAFGNYQQERAYQNAAAANAPQYAQGDYLDLERLMGVGGAQEGKSREQVEEDVARHNFETNLPEDKLARFTNQVRGQYGGSTSSQGSSLPTLYSNPGGQALGLATSLASAIPLIADGVT